MAGVGGVGQRGGRKSGSQGRHGGRGTGAQMVQGLAGHCKEWLLLRVSGSHYRGLSREATCF